MRFASGCASTSESTYALRVAIRGWRRSLPARGPIAGARGRMPRHKTARRYAPKPMPEPFTVLIMAAGQGTRMRSGTPKVLHRICGKPMVEWVVDAAREAGAARVVCVVRPGDGVAEGLPEDVEVAEQSEGEGTGSAVLAARDVVDEGPVVILSGDQ